MKNVKFLEEDDLRQIIAEKFGVETYQISIEISSVVTEYGRYGRPRIIVTVDKDNDDDD